MPGKTARVGEGTLVAQNIDEDAVTPLGMQAIDGLVEDLVVVQRTCPSCTAEGWRPRVPADLINLCPGLKCEVCEWIALKPRNSADPEVMETFL